MLACTHNISKHLCMHTFFTYIQSKQTQTNPLETFESIKGNEREESVDQDEETILR